MSVIGIYDWDFFNYTPAIPNLECGKLCAYHKKKKDITVLTPTIVSTKFYHYYIRKDYEDGLYPKVLFNDNVSYGGRAFSPIYVPLDSAIENIKPDFSDYAEYNFRYKNTQQEQALFKRVLRGAHARLSLDGTNINSDYDFERLIERDTSGIILHDYDLGKVHGACDFLRDFSQKRKTLDGEKIKPIPVGNKFPIVVDNSADFSNWLSVLAMNGIFFLRYNGLMEDGSLEELVENNKMVARQMYYSPFYGIKEEEEIIGEPLIKLFRQILFLRMNRTRIILEFEDTFSKEIQTLLKMFNYYVHSTVNLNAYSMPYTLTFYKFCAAKRVHNLKRFVYEMPSVQEIREAFAYIRVKNYDLFNMFYQIENVKMQGGQLINDK